MSISLIAIKIVLSKTSPKLRNKIDFVADKYVHLAMSSSSSLSSSSKANQMNESSNSDLKKSSGDLRQPHEITIEQYPNINDKRTATEMPETLKSSTTMATTQIPFCIGNHLVETIQGILYLYKENKLTPMGEESERSDIVCMLSVNANKTIHDILQFTAPFSQDIQHIQIIRDSTPNQYMALFKFHHQRSADEFYNSFNGTPFNSIEPDVCQLAFVAMIEVLDDDSKTSCRLPISGFTELPTCPVCLERMDESVQGILTILCSHSFHGQCLDQWGDSRCPVCRYCQTPESMPDNRCFECGSQSNIQDTLWICMICGHIGCGRYLEGHAYQHFRDTGHTYAMQLGHNNRVWDYAGDNYVHRLLQNKDGEPVELKNNNNNGSGQIIQDEKIDSVQLEYTYLLTNQLENQRHYYEETMALKDSEKQKLINDLVEKNNQLTENNNKLNNTVEDLKRSKQQLEKRLTQVSQKLQKSITELEEEKELNKCLRKNQNEWTSRLAEAEKKFTDYKTETDQEINELKDQMRDLMFFLEARDKLQNVSEVSNEEIETSTISIQEQKPGSSSNSGAGAGKRKSNKNKKK